MAPTFLRRTMLAVALVAGAMVLPGNTTPVSAADYQLTRLGWGEFQLSGSFDAVVAVPESSMLAATVRSGSQTRLVSIDTTTFEVTEGPIVGARIDTIVGSAGGTWVYLLEGENDNLGNIVRRHAWPSMEADIEFGIALDPIDLVPDGVVGRVQPVPGDEALLLVSTDASTSVVRDGVALSDQFSGSDVEAFSPTLAYGRDGRDLYELEITATGLVRGELVVADSDDRTLGRFGDRLVFDGRLFPVPLLEPAVEAEFWQISGIIDEVLGVVFSRSSGVVVVYDIDTGAELTRGPDSIGGTLIGGGIFAFAFGGGIILYDAPRIIGSYGEFTPIEPTRVFDTRSGAGRARAISEKLGPESTTRVQIHGLAGVPEAVESVVLNVTAINLDSAPSSFVTVWPSGFDRPTVSNLNFSPGSVTGNMVTVSTALDGSVDVYNGAGNVHLTVDVMGYFGSDLGAPGARFFALADIQPRRFSERRLDTRDTNEPLGPNDSLVLDLSERAALPGANLSADSPRTAVVINVAVVRPTERSFLQVFAADGEEPTASSMNFEAGANTASMITTIMSDDAQVRIRNEAGAVHIVVDVIGFYVEEDVAQRGRFIGLVPSRELDTRAESPFDGDGRMTPQSLLTQSGYGSNVVLAGNLAVIGATERGFATVSYWRAGEIGAFQRLQAFSTVNYEVGRNVANHVLVPTSVGEIGVYHDAGRSHVLFDVFGFYTGPLT